LRADLNIVEAPFLCRFETSNPTNKLNAEVTAKNETVEIAKSEPLWRFSSQHNELVTERQDLRLRKSL
jgi:hypothetical protein